MTYLEKVKPTYIENWPAAMCRLSFAQVDIPLTLEEARAVGLHIAEWGEGFIPKTPDEKEQLDKSFQSATDHMVSLIDGREKSPIIAPPKIVRSKEWHEYYNQLFEGVRRRATEALTKFPHGAIVRLGSRSPKDTWGWDKEPCISDGDPLSHIIGCSERMSDDLQLALKENYPPHIFLREWKIIPQWAEFRCFLKNKKLVGISQYYHRDVFAELEKQNETIIYWLKYFTNDSFIPTCENLSDVIFDVAVFIKQKVQESGMLEVNIECKLIEINPFFEMTDSCLFDWRSGGDFDETFRYLKSKKELIKIPL